METLIYSLKFFSKILVIAIGSYMWSEDEAPVDSAAINKEQIEYNSIEAKENELSDRSIEQDSLMISDSLYISKKIYVESKVEL